MNEKSSMNAMSIPVLASVRRLGVLLALLIAMLAVPALASAATASPGWYIVPAVFPTNFVAGGSGSYVFEISNQGAASTSGSFTITDTLPAGVTETSASVTDHAGNAVSCATAPPTVTCTDPGANGLAADQFLNVTINVAISASASGSLANSVSIAGGGASTVTSSQNTPVNSTAAAPGIEYFNSLIAGPDGTPDTTAGSHPFSYTTSFVLNNGPNYVPEGNLKDVQVNLPPGLMGAAAALPHCTPTQFVQAQCPADSQIGVTLVGLYGGNGGSAPGASQEPVYNITPTPGEPAQFGFILVQTPTYLDFSVRTGSDYGITATINDIGQQLEPAIVSLTIWGDPADPAHDTIRGGASSATPTALLSMPTSCGTPLSTSTSLDFWTAPGQSSTASSSSPALSDCNGLDFSPSLTVQPDTSAADSPSGLSVDLSFPQGGLTSPSGTAEAHLQNATVTLPQGVTVDPSAANGLTPCPPDQIGMGNANAPECPNSSEVGTVRISTPLLADPMTGGVYIAQQDNNPFGSLLAIYVTAYADGVWVKLAGHVVANPVTGQLETTFSTNPQLPFSSLELNFAGGSQAILATPQQCGTYTTTSDLSPWSGGADASPSASFSIGSGCVSGFSPSLTAGTQDSRAGAYSPLVMSLQRSDTDENFSGLSVTLPTGVLAKLSGVPECSDAELAAAAASSGAAEQASPSCPAGSQVGTVQAGSGVGPDPFFLSGQVYLTGSYNGAPYGLAIVVPAVAGPYDLGTVVVRQALQINPNTAQVTDVSDPFPTIMQGIPLDIRRIDVDLNRPGFTVNPTSCNPMAVTGTLTSTGGLSASVSSRFQVGGCSSLGFSPKLKLALSGKGKTKSSDHPKLTATLTQPSGQANIHNVRVALPLSLALDPNNSKHVCSYAIAQAVTTGPAGCPASTRVGTATAHTPLLSQPLSGPVYLVQGIRFSKGQQIHTLPSLLIPLRGQLALNLRAQTSVSGGRLVSTFPTIPDAAVSKFALTINGGPKGLLVITGRGESICTKKQQADGSFTAQSGKRTATQKITLSTPCPKPKPKPKKKHKAKRRTAPKRTTRAKEEK